MTDAERIALLEEAHAYMERILSAVITVRGLPYVTITKQQFHNAPQRVKITVLDDGRLRVTPVKEKPTP